MNEINLLELFIWSCLFTATILGMYLFSEVNGTSGSLSARKRASDVYVEGLTFTLWFAKREDRLRCIYNKEICAEMSLGFEDWCWLVFLDKFRVVYE